MRQLPHCCLWKWPHREEFQFIRRYHPYGGTSASQAVLSRMQLTLHATRRTPHGASLCLVLYGASDVCLVGQTRRAPSRIVGMRGSMVLRLPPCIIMSTSFSFSYCPLRWNSFPPSQLASSIGHDLTTGVEAGAPTAGALLGTLGTVSAIAQLLHRGLPPAEAMTPRGTGCLLYTSPSPRDGLLSRMPSSA